MLLRNRFASTCRGSVEKGDCPEVGYGRVENEGIGKAGTHIHTKHSLTRVQTLVLWGRGGEEKGSTKPRWPPLGAEVKGIGSRAVNNRLSRARTLAAWGAGGVIRTGRMRVRLCGRYNRVGVCEAGLDWGRLGCSSLLPLHPLCPSWAVWAGQPFWEELCYGCGLFTSVGSGSWGRALRRRVWSLAVALSLPGEWEIETTG